MRFLFIGILLFSIGLKAQGPYAPASWSANTSAIYKDSSIINSWATSCIVSRGLKNISNPSLGLATVGDSSKTLGKADNVVLSLGDRGEATVSFSGKIYDGAGADFVVFENGFDPNYLELAFVEVSSDGVNFFRFPAHSLTDTSVQVGAFDYLYPTYLNNLAGKYELYYGTPFDLSELSGISALDIQNITHVKVIDVVGTIDSNFASYDTAYRAVNDPFPTPYPSGGFDLDAVGAIHIQTTSVSENSRKLELLLSPNPASEKVSLPKSRLGEIVEIRNSVGKVVFRTEMNSESLDISSLKAGLYFVSSRNNEQVFTAKLIKK